MKRILLLGALVHFSTCILAQTGPAGVGNENNTLLWLSPEGMIYDPLDQSVEIWLDQSPGGRHASAEEDFAPRRVNGAIGTWPALRFRPMQANRIQVSSSSDLHSMPRLSTFIVAQSAGTSQQNTLLQFGNSSVSQGNSGYCLYLDQQQRLTAKVNGPNNSARSNVSAPEEEAMIFGFFFDAQRNNRQLRVHQNGNERGNTNMPQASIIESVDGDFFIGGVPDKEGSTFDGFISEVIMISEDLNPAEITVLENYLSGKYDLNLPGTFYESADTYYYGIAGVGRANGQNWHRVAQGTSPLRAEIAGSVGARRYLMWGHNGASLGMIDDEDVPSGIDARLERVWRFSQERGLNSLDISFQLDSLPDTDPEYLNLLVSSNGADFKSNTAAYPGVVNEGYILFPGVNIEDGYLLSLGTSNMGISPLPIELKSFRVENFKDEVKISWVTGSEINNNYFTVLRSKNPDERWEVVDILDGAGTSSSEQHYSSLDRNPLPGVSYYRLKQTDYDGTEELHEIRSVSRPSVLDNYTVKLFPNPSSDVVYVYADFSLATARVEVYDIQGKQYSFPLQQKVSHLQLSVGHLPTGAYILSIQLPELRISEKFMVVGGRAVQ